LVGPLFNIVSFRASLALAPAPRTRLSYTFARENPEISRAPYVNYAILVQARNIMDCLPKSMPAHVPRGLRQVWELAAARFALFNMPDIAL
jgi:hypothetical protein